jgi:hypothetical protein
MTSNYRVGNYGLAQAYAAVVGIVLVVSGLLGFIENPIVGPGPNGDGTNVLLAANAIHNIIHLATGALALYIAFGMSGESQANGLIGFGILYALIFILLLVDPRLFGLFRDIPANIGDHVLHAALAVTSLAIGYMAKGSRREGTATTR